MLKKLVIAACLLFATSGFAQIGYKGQMNFELAAGISQIGGITGSARINGFLSKHSVLGVGLIYDQTKYDADVADSFKTSQWLGLLQYRYAIPVGRFFISPSAGVLLGGEQCDALSAQGNLLPYKNQFVYGLLLECQAEWIIGRRWALSLTPQLGYLLNTQFDSLKVGAQVGVKRYF